MSKLLIKNSIVYTIGNFLPQAVSFILLPIYTKFLSPADYGIVASMAVLNTILCVLFTLCIERSIYRLYFDYKNELERKKFLGTIFYSTITLAGIGTILVFAFHGAMSAIYKSIPFYPYYVYTFLTCFFSVFANVPKIALQVKEKAKEFVGISILQFAITTVLTLFFVCYLKQNAEGQLKATLIANAVLLPLFLLISFRMTTFCIDLNIIKSAVKFSLPMVPCLLTAWLLNMSSRIFIEKYFNLSDVGIFSLGFKIATIVPVVIGGFDSAYSPYFFKLANADDQLENKKKLGQLNNIYALVSLSLMLLIGLFSNDILILFMNKRYAKAGDIIRILVFAYFFSGLSGIASRSIQQSKKTTQDMFITIAMALLNVGLNFILIPKLGMFGAAYATLFAYFAGFVAEYLYSTRCYFIPLNLKKLTIFIILTISLMLLFQFSLERFFYISLLCKFSILVFLCYFLIFELKKAKRMMTT